MDIHKALSSPVRNTILSTLSERPMYLSELSGKLDRKPQTIDFHMKFLLQANLVRQEWKAGKKYFILTKSAPRPQAPEQPRLPPHLQERLERIESKLDLLLRKHRLEHLY